MTSWSILYDQLTEKDKTKTWFTDGSTHYENTTKMLTVAAQQTLFGTSLQDSCDGKYLQWVEILAMCMVLPCIYGCLE